MSGTFGLTLVETLLITPEQAPLLLGSVLFSGFEVPSRISIGGAHAVTVHKLPGGGRIVDAMGVDDAAISWSGFFTGPEAAARARLVDAMRQSGAQVLLSFGDYVFSVVVVHFEYDLQDRGALISYRIRTERITEQPDVEATSLSGIFSSLVADLSTASSYISTGGSVTTMASIAASQASAALVSDPTSSSGLASIGLSLQATGASLSQDVASEGALLPASGTGGTLGISTASDVTTAVSAAGGLAASVQAAGYMNRASLSTSQLIGQTQEAPLIAL